MKKIKFLSFAECKFVAKVFRVSVILLVGLICFLKVNQAAVMATTPVEEILGGHLIENAEYKAAIKEDPEYQLMKQAAAMATIPSETELPPIEELLKVLEAEKLPTAEGFRLLTKAEMLQVISEEDFDTLAKTLYGEANCVKSKAEKSMVVWVVANRLNSGLFGKSIVEICTKPMQFTGYRPDNPITKENEELLIDVLSRWIAEKEGAENVGRTVPSDILFFSADSNPAKGEWHNKFYKYSHVTYGEKIYFDRTKPLEDPYL